MEAAIREGASWPGAVAVSGGGDSLALLLLLEEWARLGSRQSPVVLTVDHGLRRESTADAATVAARARALGLEVHILAWRGRKPDADIENAARTARYRLMGVWCRQNSITSLYAAHTIDDQAETFILRLARGSGVDGLSAMKIVAHFPSPDCEGLRVVRPLLGASRRSLRDYLGARGEGWREDEMNKDMRYARARLRAAWPAFEGVGLTTSRIASAARHLARARAALDKDVQQLLDRAVRKGRGHVLADAAQLGAAPDEIGLRALACLLIDVSGQYQRPRFERLEKLFMAIRSGALGGGRTLHGCRVYPAPKREAVFGAGTLRIGREAKRSGLVRSE